MSKQVLTSETRNALLSARAKNRKAALALENAIADGLNVPAHVAAKMRGVEEWLNAQLAPAKAPAKKSAKKAAKKAA